MSEKKYYTAKEAQSILGMTYSALRNQVNAGHIESVTPPGKRQAVYSKADVDQLRKEMDAWLASRAHTGTSPSKFMKATIEDMPEAVALADAVFGRVNTIPVEKRVEWLKKNPDIDYLVKQDDQLVGYLSLIPLTPETISDLLNKRRLAKDLTADDIIAYEPGIPVDVYAMAIGVRPGFSMSQKRDIGMILLSGFQDVLIDLGHRGIVIRSIKAHSSMPDGIRLMRHAGFTETEASIKGLRDFAIEVEPSGIPFIMRYKEALRGYKDTQDTQLTQVNRMSEEKNEDIPSGIRSQSKHIQTRKNRMSSERETAIHNS